MEDSSIKILKIGALKFFPEDTSMDQKVQSEILKLWQSKHSFIILSGPPGVGKTRASEDFVLEVLKHCDAPHSKEACRIMLPAKLNEHGLAGINETLAAKKRPAGGLGRENRVS